MGEESIEKISFDLTPKEKKKLNDWCDAHGRMSAGAAIRGALQKAGLI